jgi:hypothetical protein
MEVHRPQDKEQKWWFFWWHRWRKRFCYLLTNKKHMNMNLWRHVSTYLKLVRQVFVVPPDRLFPLNVLIIPQPLHITGLCSEIPLIMHIDINEL